MEEDPLSVFVKEDEVSKKEVMEKLKTSKIRGNMVRLGIQEPETSELSESTLIPTPVVTKPDDVSPRGNEQATERVTRPRVVSTNQREEDEILEKEYRMLSGERSLMHLTDAKIFGVAARMLSGILDMTNYRLIFIPSQVNSSTLSSRIYSIISHMAIPLACIDHIEKDKRQKDGNSVCVGVFCKDSRSVHLILSAVDAERAIQAITAYAFPNSIDYLFAFCHSPLPAFGQSGWNVFNMTTEFDRQGIFRDRSSGTKTPWRISTANEMYTLCESYPSLLVVPREISDRDLFQVAYFRAGGRLPALSWGSNTDSASIWRSSQPKVGVSNNTNETDERMLDCLSRYSTAPRQTGAQPILQIIDCRPKSNAMANRATGHGYEIQTNYPNTRLDFFNICNIHAMRESNAKLVAMCQSSGVDDVSWGAALEDTKWLPHVRCILSASHKVAQLVHKDRSAVLIHCSHGWDRTSQVSCLAQIMLDPFYRTFKGFQVLVEKDWLAFGHPFQLRCAHGVGKPERDDDQMCPVFVQFLDCVWQMLNLFPQHFEYNSRFLLALADQVYSCRFGTFLGNCEAQRSKLTSRCSSVWGYLDMNRQSLSNPLFVPASAAASSPTVFIPVYNELMRGVTIWADYHFRWSFMQSNPQIPHNLKPYICGTNHPCGPLPTNREEVEMHDQICLHNVADINLPPYFSASDHWEAYFWKERAQKETLQHLLISISRSLDQIATIHESNGNRSESVVGNEQLPATEIVRLLQDVQRVADSVAQPCGGTCSSSMPMNWMLSILRNHSFPQVTSPSLPSTSVQMLPLTRIASADNKKDDFGSSDISDTSSMRDDIVSVSVNKQKATHGLISTAGEIVGGVLKSVKHDLPIVASSTAGFIVGSLLGSPHEKERVAYEDDDNDGNDDDDWQYVEKSPVVNTDDADIDNSTPSKKSSLISSLIDDHMDSELFSSRTTKATRLKAKDSLFEDPLNPFN